MGYDAGTNQYIVEDEAGELHFGVHIKFLEEVFMPRGYVPVKN